MRNCDIYKLFISTCAFYVNRTKESVQNIWYVFWTAIVLELMWKVPSLSTVESEALDCITRNWNHGKLFCKALFAEDTSTTSGLLNNSVVCEWNQ